MLPAEKDEKGEKGGERERERQTFIHDFFSCSTLTRDTSVRETHFESPHIWVHTYDTHTCRVRAHV